MTTTAMTERTTFEYLLNAMENAAQQETPADHGYGAKRKAVLVYVAALVEKMAGKDDLLAAYRMGGNHTRADRALARIERADAKLAVLEALTASTPSSVVEGVHP